MKFNDFNKINESNKKFELYVVKKETKVTEDLHPWIDSKYDDYEQYVDVIIKVKDNDKDYIALTVGVNQDDGDFKVIDKNIHVNKENKDLLKFINLSDDEIDDLASSAAEDATS